MIANCCIMLGFSLLALAQQAKATLHCQAVDVVFIMDSSECISQANFQKEKNFVKEAALKLGVATGQSRAAIIQFSRAISLKGEQKLTQYPSRKQFEKEVDELARELPSTPNYAASTVIDTTLYVAKLDFFKNSGTRRRRVAILLLDGGQVIAAKDVPKLKEASKYLREEGVRLLVVTMGTSSSELDKILKSVTEREEDVVMEHQFNDLLNKLPRMIACGSCVCTSGDSYITISNYQSKKKSTEDDIRFEFKSHMTNSGLFMSAEGSHVDFVSVGYENKQLWYDINLGSGARKIQSMRQLKNGNGWHKVHITRNERSVKMNIGDGNDPISESLPGKLNSLDIQSSTGYFLGAPEGRSMEPNFIGCIRYFTVDGYEPIVNAWLGNQDTSIVKGSMRPCTAADEML